MGYMANEYGHLNQVPTNQEDISTHMLAAAGVMPKTPDVLRKPVCAAAHALGILGGDKGQPGRQCSPCLRHMIQ